MPPKKLRNGILNYTPDQMKNAVDDVRSGSSVAAAARRHSVPRITLLYKCRGKTRIERRMGPDPILSTNEELLLVNWIQSMARAGFPVTKTELINSVIHLMKELNKVSKFKSGNKWIKSFLKRHPSVTLRTAENITLARACVSGADLQNWFQNIYNYFEEENLLNVLKEPSRLFNSDESAFFLNPKGNKVLSTKGEKKVYQVVNCDEKECITVLVTANAAGLMAPPLLVFKYERIPSDIASSVPPEWGVGRSENGWMTGPLFFEYMANVFHPWLLENDIPLPVIFFMDGHVSHLTLHTSQFCSEKGIILVALHPNATHLIQPMDVAVFRALKGKWKDKVHEWRIENLSNPVLKKKDFAPILCKVLSERNPTIISNGFKKFGLLPWNPKAPLEEGRSPLNEPTNRPSDGVSWSHTNTTTTNTRILTVLEKAIGREKVILFNSKENKVIWDGDIEDKSLFEVWKKIKDQTFSHDDMEDNTVMQLPETSITQSSCPETQVIPDSIQDISASYSNLPNVPSPFKKALHWPETHITTKRKRELFPCVVTSQPWIDYHRKKNEKKLEMEENKKKRAAERERKKEEKEEIKKINLQKKKTLTTKKKKKIVSSSSSSSSEEEEWIPSGNSVDDASLNLSDHSNWDYIHPPLDGNCGKNSPPKQPDMGLSIQDDESLPVENQNEMANEDTLKVNNTDVNKQNERYMNQDDEDIKSNDLPLPDSLLKMRKIDNEESTSTEVLVKKGSFILCHIRKLYSKKTCKLAMIVSEVFENSYKAETLNPLTRLRNVFVRNSKDVRTISPDQIFKILQTPLLFGSSTSPRYQFCESLDVDW